MAGAWRAKQEAQTGTSLPTDFPYLSELSLIGYTTIGDLAGSDEYELVEAGLSYRQARAVLAALSEI
jgi:hypothetical protein